jgi:hypothetical protein
MLVIAGTEPVSAADEQPADKKESTDWSTTFRDDLQAARHIILESHPGPVDALNPRFGDWLDAGFEQQIALTESIDSADAYVYAMLKFVGGFRDGHLGVRFDVDQGPPRWPGFFATWRNNTVVIHTVDPALVSELAEGDRLRSPGASGELGTGGGARLCRSWKSVRRRSKTVHLRPRKPRNHARSRMARVLMGRPQG